MIIRTTNPKVYLQISILKIYQKSHQTKINDIKIPSIDIVWLHKKKIMLQLGKLTAKKTTSRDW